MNLAHKADAVIVTLAQETFRGGYAGCLKDSDGHLRKVPWNPKLRVND